MQGDSLGEHVISNASHLDCIGCEELASIHEAAASEGHRVVPLVHNEHSNDSLVAIDNEVSAKLVHVLLLLDELLFRQAT